MGLSARCIAGVRGSLFAAFYCTVLERVIKSFLMEIPGMVITTEAALRRLPNPAVE